MIRYAEINDKLAWSGLTGIFLKADLKKRFDADRAMSASKTEQSWAFSVTTFSGTSSRSAPCFLLTATSADADWADSSCSIGSRT